VAPNTDHPKTIKTNPITNLNNPETKLGPTTPINFKTPWREAWLTTVINEKKKIGPIKSALRTLSILRKSEIIGELTVMAEAAIRVKTKTKEFIDL
jgi:hypothetical protein